MKTKRKNAGVHLRSGTQLVDATFQIPESIPTRIPSNYEAIKDAGGRVVGYIDAKALWHLVGEIG